MAEVAPVDAVVEEVQQVRHDGLGPLGLKQLGEDPWVGIARRYPQGTRLFGKVTNQEVADALKAKYGMEVDKRKISIDTIKEVGDACAANSVSAGTWYRTATPSNIFSLSTGLPPT